MKKCKGPRFKELREEYNDARPNNKKRLTQNIIASKIGCHPSHICKLEKEGQGANLDDFKYYTKKFGVSIEYLLGLSESRLPENMKVGKDLGINDAVADTMATIHKMSNEYYNFDAVLHAFIGNGEATVSLLSGILDYLTSEKENGNDYRTDALIFNRIMTYINTFVKPQIQEVIDKRVAEDELRAEHNTNYTPTQEEIDYFNNIPDTIPDDI